MPRFEPFRAIHFSPPVDVTSRTSPPYDVFDEAARDMYASADRHNIVAVDYPLERDGSERYQAAADVLNRWLAEGVLVEDDTRSFSVYRMSFRDETGKERTVSGVIGALEVVDEGAPGVLPHERTTPKAKTDRLDLTRATQANLSPVWGLSLASGLTEAIASRRTPIATCVDEQGVHHSLEIWNNPDDITAISRIVSSAPVLIADGHHRYAISRTYRDERSAQGSVGGASLTMTFVQELNAEQLSVAAIHRLYDIDHHTLTNALTPNYAPGPVVDVSPEVLTAMDTHGAICVVGPDGKGQLFTEKEAVFTSVRALDSARLEHTLADVPHTVSYQHGVAEVLRALADGKARSAVLIRPVSLTEIRRTAETGELMPPKSTFFTPKLRTGLVMRKIDD